MLAFGFGVLNTVALCLFLYSGDGLIVNILSMILFGVAIGVKDRKDGCDWEIE